MKLEVLASQIRKLDADCIAAGRQFIVAAIECGKLLILARAKIKSGDWETWMECSGVSKQRATFYIRGALYAIKNPKEASALVEQGAPFVQLLRAAGIVRACEGGGYRSEVYQARKLLGKQMTFDFLFEEFESHVQSLCKAKNVEKLSDSSLDKIETDLLAGLDRVREVKKQRAAIIIEPTE
jgi:hypothetical protein